MKKLPTAFKLAIPLGLIITIFIYTFNVSEFGSLIEALVIYTISTMFVIASYFITFNEN